MENNEAYERALRRAKAKLGFYIHLTVYIVINLLLIIINLSTSSQYLWFKWPLLGWSIGLFFHSISVFLFTSGYAIFDKMIEKEMEKEALRKQKR